MKSGTVFLLLGVIGVASAAKGKQANPSLNIVTQSLSLGLHLHVLFNVVSCLSFQFQSNFSYSSLNLTDFSIGFDWISLFPSS